MSSPLRSDTFGQRLREVARLLIIYWLFLFMMFAAFSLAILVDDPSAGSIGALAFFAGITVVGVLVGQLAALARLRDWVLYTNLAAFWTLGMALSVFTALAAGTLGAFIAAFVLLFPLFVIGGAWSLRAGRALVGTWVPLLYATACAIVVAENKGSVESWHQGDKWAIWDGYTLVVLVVCILLMLGFLIARETHRLQLWRHGPAAPLAGTVRETGAARPRLSCLGWVLVAGLALFLSVGTAVLAPYLWRTGPGDRESDNGGGEPVDEPYTQPDEPTEKAKTEKKPSKVKERWDKARGDSDKEMSEATRPAPNQGLDPLMTLLTSLVLFLLLLFTFWRPARRLLLTRHFERALLRRSPTDRIRNGWRLVEIALGDAGVEPRPGEPAATLLRRALPVLQRISPAGVEVHGLAEAAEIRDRVEYGLGVHPEDVRQMERVARWTYHTVWDRLSEWERVKQVYRGI